MLSKYYNHITLLLIFLKINFFILKTQFLFYKILMSEKLEQSWNKPFKIESSIDGLKNTKDPIII